MAEVEIFEYLKSKSRIGDFDIDDLYNLLSSPGDDDTQKAYKDYRIRLSNGDFILIYNKSKNKTELLNCVKDYYNLENNQCSRIRKDLGTYNDNHESCIKCHLKCIEKRKSGQL